MTPQTFIFFGRSGCGKGTQAELLIKHLEGQGEKKDRVVYIESGAKLREFADEVGLTSELTAKIMKAGELLPSFIPIWIWTNTFIRHLRGDEHIVLDGVSRRSYEAPILHDALKFYKRENPTVIIMNVSREWSKKRLLARGRGDDTEADIEERLTWYETNVMPTIEFFKKDPYYKIVEVNAEQTIEQVQKEILAKL